MPEANELTRAERGTLAWAIVPVIRKVFSEFPELRLFPEVVGEACAGMHILYSDQGLNDVEILNLMGSPQGVIAIAGTVYSRMNGRHVGADAQAIEHGML